MSFPASSGPERCSGGAGVEAAPLAASNAGVGAAAVSARPVAVEPREAVKVMLLDTTSRGWTERPWRSNAERESGRHQLVATRVGADMDVAH